MDSFYNSIIAIIISFIPEQQWQIVLRTCKKFNNAKIFAICYKYTNIVPAIANGDLLSVKHFWPHCNPCQTLQYLMWPMFTGLGLKLTQYTSEIVLRAPHLLPHCQLRMKHFKVVVRNLKLTVIEGAMINLCSNFERALDLLENKFGFPQSIVDYAFRKHRWEFLLYYCGALSYNDLHKLLEKLICSGNHQFLKLLLKLATFDNLQMYKTMALIANQFECYKLLNSVKN